MQTLKRAVLAVLACLCVSSAVLAGGAGGFISYQEEVVTEEIGPGGGGHVTCYRETRYITYSDGRTEIKVREYCE